jgi:hypothetical protein
MKKVFIVFLLPLIIGCPKSDTSSITQVKNYEIYHKALLNTQTLEHYHETRTIEVPNLLTSDLLESEILPFEFQIYSIVQTSEIDIRDTNKVKWNFKVNIEISGIIHLVGVDSEEYGGQTTDVQGQVNIQSSYYNLNYTSKALISSSGQEESIFDESGLLSEEEALILIEESFSPLLYSQNPDLLNRYDVPENEITFTNRTSNLIASFPLLISSIDIIGTLPEELTSAGIEIPSEEVTSQVEITVKDNLFSKIIVNTDDIQTSTRIVNL